MTVRLAARDKDAAPSTMPSLPPQCGARTRAGGPCRMPAMANGRCRMHGGLSTGPRTPEGMARMIAAKTTHGRYAVSSEPQRAAQLYVRAVVVRGRVLCTATRLRAYLPPEMAARLELGPPELKAPKHPSQVAFERLHATTPCSPPPPGHNPPGHDPTGRKPAGGTRRRAGRGRASVDAKLALRGRKTERLAARAEAASRDQWRSAIAFAQGAKCAAKRAARSVGRKTRNDPMRGMPEGARVARPEGDNAARAGGLLTLGEALAREVMTRRLRAELALRRNDPVECLPPCAGPDGDPPSVPGPTRPSPTKATALGSTTLARTWEPSTSEILDARFGPAAPVGWQGPQMPPTGIAAILIGSYAQRPHEGGATREPAAECAKPATTL
jgi:hypothetical protein